MTGFLRKQKGFFAGQAGFPVAVTTVASADAATAATAGRCDEPDFGALCRQVTVGNLKGTRDELDTAIAAAQEQHRLALEHTVKVAPSEKPSQKADATEVRSELYRLEKDRAAIDLMIERFSALPVCGNP